MALLIVTCEHMPLMKWSEEHYLFIYLINLITFVSKRTTEHTFWPQRWRSGLISDSKQMLHKFFPSLWGKEWAFTFTKAAILNFTQDGRRKSNTTCLRWFLKPFNSISIQFRYLHAPTYKLITCARDEHRKHDPQVRDFKKKSEFSIWFWNCSARDQGRAGALEVHSRQQTMRNRILADLSSWFSSGGLTEIFQVSQMIWGECAPWQACRGPTGTEVRVRGGTWTRACTVWNLMRSGISSQCNCRRMMSETDARCGSCRTSLAAARRTHCNFSCRYFGPAARSPLQ